jgi:carbamoyltransferase
LKPSKNRAILGINAYSHDAGVALVVDGTLVFAAEEERYDRLKHSHAFPAGALRAALAHAGLAPGDVDLVAFCWRKDMARRQKALYVLRHLPRSLAFLRERPERLPPRMRYLRSVAHLERDLLASGVEAPVTYVEHHFAHAIQAHRFGPADEAALLTADGMGEWTAAAAWHVEHRGGLPRLLAAQDYPHSLGKVYAAVTQHLGFRPDADEGKTMGLASYGRPTLKDAFRALVRPHANRLYEVDLTAFAYRFGKTCMGGAPFAARFGPPRTPEGPIEARDEDLAHAAQAVLEDTVLGMARRLREQTGASHLGLAGGLFLNCVLNGRLAREAGFDSLFVFPAAGDAGAAVGAAAWVAGLDRRSLRHAYLGDPCEDAAVARALGDRPHRVAADPAAAAAEALDAGRIVGWFHGRMEFGPRALGARSILADPRGKGIKDRLNAEVKFREAFRPFAPAVLEEAAGDWFADALPSPFMLLAFTARDRARERIPGVVHVDGTARVQTVGRDDGQPAFRRLLEAFQARTGVPVVLNTSFNIRGEPIVRTPEEALACFDRTGMDLLVLGDRVVEKA